MPVLFYILWCPLNLSAHEPLIVKGARIPTVVWTASAGVPAAAAMGVVGALAARVFFTSATNFRS